MKMSNHGEKEKETIAIVASEQCLTIPPEGKRWFSLGKFIQAYHPLLARYDIVTNDSTRALLHDELSRWTGPASMPRIESVGDAFLGFVSLAARVARGEVKRVLMFEDPRDLHIEKPQNYALLRNCNINGGHLYINASAHLWAVHECERRALVPGVRYLTRPVANETVALIAHDREKPRMARFVLHYHQVLEAAAARRTGWPSPASRSRPRPGR
jgi:methylglyoxal synthase